MRPKKSFLFPEIALVKFFLLPTRPRKLNVYENMFYLFQQKQDSQTKKFSLANLFVQMYLFSLQT